MATSGRIVSEFAASAGWPDWAVARTVENLRAAGLAPYGKSGSGRSQEHGQYEVDHISNLLLALSAPMLTRVADAVRRLRALTNAGGETLGAALERAISEMAQSNDPPDAIAALSLCFEIPSAAIHWNGRPHPERFIGSETDSPGKRGGVVRTTSIQSEVIGTAVALAADAMKHQARQASDTTTENAALPGAAPIQDQKLGPSSSRREPKARLSRAQGPTSRDPGFSSSQPRSSTRDPTPHESEDPALRSVS